MPSEGPILENSCYRLRDAGAAALERIENSFNEKEGVLKSIAYAIKGRVKLKHDIVAKVLRKRFDPRKPLPNYEPDDVTDICGLRIVTLFQRDIPEVVEYLLKLLNGKDATTVSPFVKGKVKKIQIYTNRPVGDPLSITDDVRKTVVDSGHEASFLEPTPSRNAYSSVHFVFYCRDVKYEHADGTVKLGDFPVEIQVRNVFEDAWGEIDHKLRYRQRRLVVAEKSDRGVELWEPHLNALKTIVDGASQYADIIKRHVIDQSSSDSGDGFYLSPLESIVDAMQTFAHHPQQIQIKMRAAFRVRERLELANSAFEKSKAAVEMREAFEAIERTEQQYLSQDSEGARILSYYLKMEQAFALLFVGQDEPRKAAIEIYTQTLKSHPESPSVYYRLGQALNMAGSYLEAIEVLTQGRRAMQATNHVAAAWLASAMPRNLAFAYWNMSRSLLGDARLAALKEAYMLTRASLEAAKRGEPTEARSRNSFLYYGIEYLELAGNTPTDFIDQEELLDSLETLEVDIDLKRTTDLKKLDTICRARWFFRDDEGTEAAATRIVEVIQAMDGTVLDDEERSVLQYALGVLDSVADSRSRAK